MLLNLEHKSGFLHLHTLHLESVSLELGALHIFANVLLKVVYSVRARTLQSFVGAHPSLLCAVLLSLNLPVRLLSLGRGLTIVHIELKVAVAIARQIKLVCFLLLLWLDELLTLERLPGLRPVVI